MTKAAALEARKHDIRVNAVSPGFLQTKLFESVSNNAAVNPDAWTTYEKRQGRAASTDEIGDVVVLLSTPRMSLVNGHNLVIEYAPAKWIDMHLDMLTISQWRIHDQRDGRVVQDILTSTFNAPNQYHCSHRCPELRVPA